MMRTVKELLYQEIPFLVSIHVLLWQSIYFLVPLFLITTYAFYGVSLNTLSTVFDSVHASIIFTSLALALGVSITCLFIAYPVAYWIAWRVKRFKILFLFLLTVPFWTNLLILSYSWILLLEKQGLIARLVNTFFFSYQHVSILNSFWAIFFVSVYCYFPFMVFPIYASLAKIDTHILESSADLGATSFQTFRNIIIPLSWSGMRTGLLLVLVPMYGEFAIPALVGGDKYMLVGNTIAHYVFVSFDFFKAASFTLFAIVVLLLSLVFFNKVAKYILGYYKVSYE